MVDAWVSGAERIASSKSGNTYREPSSPWRFVFHTMEAPANATTGLWSTISGLKSYIAGHAAPPHLWCWPQKNWVGQTIPLTLSSYALRHESGDPETNHKHAIQVEVLGYANDQPVKVFAEWLGARVVRPVLEAGVPLNVAHTAPSTGSDGYGLNGAVRQSWNWWAGFDGICGHANVPGNSHWDPGVADYVAAGLAATGQQPQEDDLTPEELQQGLVAFSTRRLDDGAFMIREALGRSGAGLKHIERQNAALAAQVAALATAVAQLGAGGDIDYTRVEEAAEKAVKDVLGGLDTEPSG